MLLNVNSMEEKIEEQKHNGKAVVALVLGIADLILWFFPILGLAGGIVGLVMGIKGRKSEKKVMATIGIVLCILGIIASIIVWIITTYLYVTGKVQLFK